MTSENNYIINLITELKKISEINDEEIQNFYDLYLKKEYRNAYQYFYFDLIKNKKLVMNDALNKAQEDFYWYYVN